MSLEIEQERDHLARADRGIAEGQNRVERQRRLAGALAAKGQDSAEAARLLALLEQTLAQWALHRALIVDRITYLEGRAAVAPALPHRPGTFAT